MFPFVSIVSSGAEVDSGFWPVLECFALVFWCHVEYTIVVYLFCNVCCFQKHKILEDRGG